MKIRSLLLTTAATLALTLGLGFTPTADAGRRDDDSRSGGSRWDDDSSGGSRWDDDSSGCRKNCGGGGGGSAVPEIDPNAARAAAILLAGGLALVRYRRD